MRFFLFLICFSLSGIVLSLQDIQAEQQSADSARLRSNILALDRVQKNIRRTMGSRKSAHNLSGREERELLIFVDYLRERNRQYCGQLEKQVGQEAVADLPCPDELPEPPGMKARTTGEELADLDRQLDASLGEFDEMLLKEQERIAAHRPRQRESAGSATSGGAGDFGGQQGKQGNGTDSGIQGARSEAGREQGRASGAVGQRDTTGPAAATGTKNSGSPGQAQSGSVNGTGRDRLHADDDIVARQLREAAEKETDPELKEKLWQEYDKYKAGL